MISCYGKPSDAPWYVLWSKIHAVHREHVHWVTYLSTTNTPDLNTCTVRCMQLEMFWDTASRTQVNELLKAIKVTGKWTRHPVVILLSIVWNVQQQSLHNY
jgi:hypothetical protein